MGSFRPVQNDNNNVYSVRYTTLATEERSFALPECIIDAHTRSEKRGIATQTMLCASYARSLVLCSLSLQRAAYYASSSLHHDACDAYAFPFYPSCHVCSRSAMPDEVELARETTRPDFPFVERCWPGCCYSFDCYPGAKHR